MGNLIVTNLNADHKSLSRDCPIQRTDNPLLYAVK